MHNVNATSDAFGNGIFDGWSIAVGHEYAEAVTDPDNFASVQDGWNDAQGNENGDKCAWMNTQNINLASHSFAVQLRLVWHGLAGQPAALGAQRGDVVQQAVLGFRRQVAEEPLGDPCGGLARVKARFPQGRRPIVPQIDCDGA